MRRTGYWIILAVASVLVSSVAVWAGRTGGTRRLWLATLGCATALALVGLLDWIRLPDNETHFGAYVATAVLPSLLTALTIQWLRSREAAQASQIVVGAIVWLVVAAITLVLNSFS